MLSDQLLCLLVWLDKCWPDIDGPVSLNSAAASSRADIISEPQSPSSCIELNTSDDPESNAFENMIDRGWICVSR